MMFKNPFMSVNANQLTDEEINNFWAEGFYEDFMQIDSPMPIVILGGRGAGKTHLMRYFFYKSQKNRLSNNNLKQSIINDGYIGVWFRLSGLNMEKFTNKQNSNYLFLYYINLLVTEFTLIIINDILSAETIVNEKHIINKLKSLFLKSNEKIENISNLDTFKNYISELRKEIDFAFNNYYNNDEYFKQISININSADMILELPKIICKEIIEFKDLKILYLFDEIENLTDEQLIVFNTIIRQQKNKENVSLRLGGRLYSHNVKKTMDNGEEIKVPSDYIEKIIDSELREKASKYKDIALTIFLKRFNSEDKLKNFISITKSSIPNLFQEYDLLEGIKTFDKTKKIHFNKFNKFINKRFDSQTKNLLIKHISNEDLFIEKKNMLCVYKSISKTEKLTNENIQKLISKFHTTKHYDNDLVKQLYKEYDKPLYFSGFDTIIEITKGSPRYLLSIYREIFNNLDDEFLKEKVISYRIQNYAIRKVADKFWEEAYIDYENFNLVRMGIDRLCKYFNRVKLSMNLPEKSLISFSFNETNLDKESRGFLTLAEKTSLLITTDTLDRKTKNQSGLEKKYRLNPLLCVRWELSIVVGGTTEFSSDLIKALFTEDITEWKKFEDSKINQYNLIQDLGLFNDIE